jgi:hypothetical protein
MTVEFILPRELLNEPVHEWLLDEDDEYSYLAADHIVIVRDLQRQRRSTSVLKWRQKWEWINLVGDVSACPGVWISCDVAPPDPGTLRLEYDRDAAVALGMTFQPELNGRRSHLATALNRGIPVAVWRRVKCDEHGAATQAGQCAGARFRTELNQGLTDEDIHRLPRYVHEKRKEGLMHDEYWRDVILLWDDPTRIPDRLRLDAP